MVGERGFEPLTFWSRTKRATRLRYSPEEKKTNAPHQCRSPVVLLKGQDYTKVGRKVKHVVFACSFCGGNRVGDRGRGQSMEGAEHTPGLVCCAPSGLPSAPASASPSARHSARIREIRSSKPVAASASRMIPRGSPPPSPPPRTKTNALPTPLPPPDIPRQSATYAPAKQEIRSSKPVAVSASRMNQRAAPPNHKSRASAPPCLRERIFRSFRIAHDPARQHPPITNHKSQIESRPGIEIAMLKSCLT